MGLVSIPLVLLLAGLYYLIYYMVFSQMLIPEAISVTLLPAMKKVNIVLLITLPVALGLLLRAALIRSNRIVGPIPRLKKELNRVIAGDYSIKIKTRKNDELRSFVNKVNSLVEELKKK
jgi:signal transduction histidine kinase